MHGKDGNLRLILALAISLAVAFLCCGLAASFVLAAVVTGLVMVAVAHRHFNGVTGDVFGATNEFSRMVCAVVLLAVISWYNRSCYGWRQRHPHETCSGKTLD